MTPASVVSATAIAGHATGAMTRELLAFPKPGLVSEVDNGAHADMDHLTMKRSIAALAPAFASLAMAGADGAGFDAVLRPIGVQAETEMLIATDGVNTHRGAIFCIGMLAAAAGALTAGRAVVDREALRGTMIEVWGSELAAHARHRAGASSHGADASRRYGARGAAAEAADGFPAVFEHAVPALASAQLEGLDENAARVHALFTLIAELDDTNLLHRGGRSGADHARSSAREFVSAGGCFADGWEDVALAIHHDFVGRNLSPGGCADLLAAADFVLALGGEEAPRRGAVALASGASAGSAGDR